MIVLDVDQKEKDEIIKFNKDKGFEVRDFKKTSKKDIVYLVKSNYFNTSNMSKL